MNWNNWSIVCKTWTFVGNTKSLNLRGSDWKNDGRDLVNTLDLMDWNYLRSTTAIRAPAAHGYSSRLFVFSLPPPPPPPVKNPVNTVSIFPRMIFVTIFDICIKLWILEFKKNMENGIKWYPVPESDYWHIQLFQIMENRLCSLKCSEMCTTNRALHRCKNLCRWWGEGARKDVSPHPLVDN